MKKTNVTGLDWMTKKEPAGMPAASSVSAEPKSEAPKPAPTPAPVAEAPKMDAPTATAEKTPASEPVVSQETMPASEEKTVLPSETPKKELTVAVPEPSKYQGEFYKRKVEALAKNMRIAMKNPEFAKQAGISEQDIEDFKEEFYDRGGFDDKDYNMIMNDYKDIGMSPQSFRKEVEHYPGVDVAIKAALGDDNVKKLLKDIGINEDALSDKYPEDDTDGDYHSGLYYLLEHLYENGTPEQIKTFGRELRNKAFIDAASKFVKF